MSAFRRLGNDGDRVRVSVDGEALEARAGDSVATALIAAGRLSFSINPKTGEPSAPFCLIGICFGCLCTVDGRPGVQACLAPVREGMAIDTGRAHPRAGAAS